MEKEKLKNSTENYLFRIIALERNGNHDEALRFFNKLLGNNLDSKEIHEIRRFLKETACDSTFMESGRHSDYERAFYGKYPRRKRRSRSRKKAATKRFRILPEEIFWPLVTGFLAGLYVSVFYIANNLTMLPGASIAAMFFILTVPVLALVIVTFCIFKIIRKNDLIPPASILVSAVYMLFVLHPAITKLDSIGYLLSLLGGAGSFWGNVFYAVIPAGLLVFIFKGDTKKFSFVLGVMAITAMVMGLSGLFDTIGPGTKSTWANWEKYKDTKLAKKPNIFFIIPDSYGSVALMRDLKIDISAFQRFLAGQQFKIYDDTYSNYQPTTNSLPAFLNMEHHYYTITFKNHTEVFKSGRLIIGGDNNFFTLLKKNGYRRQIIHQGPSMLLQGHNVDYCFPEVTGLAGAKIVLGRILNREFLSEEEQTWEKYSAETVHKEAVVRMPKDKTEPVVQYIHLFEPAHTSNAIAGRCDEKEQVELYADRIEKTNAILENLINAIIGIDPEAVIIVAGDHGPYILDKCNRDGVLTTPAQIRDRAGIFTAIRWPSGYDGRYDGKIKTAANILRFVLASLAKNETEIIKTAVPDDVYVKMKNFRKNNDFFKIIEEGNILEQPKNLNIPVRLRAAN